MMATPARQLHQSLIIIVLLIKLFTIYMIAGASAERVRSRSDAWMDRIAVVVVGSEPVAILSLSSR